MDPRLQPGFLGTGASLLSDLTLLAYILLIVPAMLIGFVFARRKLFRPHHKAVMTGITLVNWALILYVMAVSYAGGVAPGIPGALGDVRIWLPTVHLLFGAAAQLLATYAVVRMWREDTQTAAAKKRGESGDQLRRYWFKAAKPVMRAALALWLLTAALGIGTYAAFYGGGAAASAETPAETPEPAATPEAGAATSEPAATPEATPES
jgi:uncharacterized membrane protein YozB (DUF420 family)